MIELSAKRMRVALVPLLIVSTVLVSFGAARPPSGVQAQHLPPPGEQGVGETHCRSSTGLQHGEAVALPLECNRQ